jgi:hypothetical protein
MHSMSAAVSIGQASRFAIERALGSGGMGVVYLAHDRERRMRVALKTLLTSSPVELARLKREFRALADVAHPGLVELYELFADGGQWFFTMEAIDGVPFDAWCARDPVPGEHDELVASRLVSRSHVTLKNPRGAVDDSDDAWVVRERPAADLGKLDAALAKLADAIRALHDAGKLHCDLKPSNVLVTPEGRVVVLDFGLVRERPEKGQEDDSLEGTPGYLAPELAGNLAPTAAADWYGVGVMLFQAITGTLPFGHGFFAQVLARQLMDAPPRTSERVHGVPDALDALVHGLMDRDPATRLGEAAIRAYLGHGASLTSAEVEPEPALVGRDAELAELDASFRDAAQGRPRFALVRGPSGIGKSALVRHFTRTLAARREALVLAGRCYEREDVPFKALDSVVDALAAHLARLPGTQVAELVPDTAGALAVLFPVLRAVDAIAALPPPDASLDPSAVRAQAAQAARAVFARLGAVLPVVIAIDDLQWGDLDSATFLAAMIDPSSTTPVLFVASVRSDTAESDVVRAIRTHARRVTTIDLAPLTDAACLALAATALGGAAERAHEIAAEAHGSPFFALELARHVGRGGTALAGTVDDVVRARLADVPEGARVILELSALAGVPVPVRVIERAAGLSTDSLASLRWLGARSLVRSNVRREIEPYHDRIREVVASGLGDRARALHARLGDALASEPTADAEAVAHHLAEGGDTRRALTFLVPAAERASAALAFDHAVALYRRALTLESTSAIRERLAEALVLTGRASEAAPMFAECARAASGAEASRLWRRAAEEWLKSGRVDEGVAMLRHVLQGVGLRYPDAQAEALARALVRILRVRFLEPTWTERDEKDVPPATLARVDAARAAGVGLMLVDPLRGYGFLARFLLDAKAAGEPRRVAAGLALNAVTLCRGGEPGYAKAKRFLDVSRGVAARFDDDYLRGLADACEAGISVCTGRWQLGHTLGLSAPLTLRRSGTPATWESTVSLSLARTALYFSGHLAQLRPLTAQHLRGAEDVGDLFAATYARVHGWFAAAMDDDVPAGRAALDEALANWSHLGFHAMHFWALFGQLQYDRYEGAHAQGIARIERVRKTLKSSRILAMQFYRVFLTATEMLLRIDARDARGAEKLVATLAKEGPGYATALATLGRAKLAKARGDHDGARRSALEAATAFDDSDMRLHAAAARALGGERDAALALVAADGVKSPEKWLAMLA